MVPFLGQGARRKWLNLVVIWQLGGWRRVVGVRAVYIEGNGGVVLHPGRCADWTFNRNEIDVLSAHRPVLSAGFCAPAPWCPWCADKIRRFGR